MRGTYLAQHWQGKHLVKLYHLWDGGRGFFAEVGVDEDQEQFVVLRSFGNSEPLAEYTQGVRLPK